MHKRGDKTHNVRVTWYACASIFEKNIRACVRRVEADHGSQQQQPWAQDSMATSCQVASRVDLCKGPNLQDHGLVAGISLVFKH
eukprot:3816437-Amphidinium_carterae.1